MKVGDLVRIDRDIPHLPWRLVGIVIDVNDAPVPGLVPMPYRVRWVNPPDGHPEVQSTNGEHLEVVSESR